MEQKHTPSFATSEQLKELDAALSRCGENGVAGVLYKDSESKLRRQFHTICERLVIREFKEKKDTFEIERETDRRDRLRGRKRQPHDRLVETKVQRSSPGAN